MKATDFGMNCRGIIIFLALLYQPKKKTSLSAYGDSDTNAIYRNARKQFSQNNSYVYVDNYPLFLYSIIKRGKCLCYIACVFDKH